MEVFAEVFVELSVHVFAEPPVEVLDQMLAELLLEVHATEVHAEVLHSAEEVAETSHSAEVVGTSHSAEEVETPQSAEEAVGAHSAEAVHWYDVADSADLSNQVELEALEVLVRKAG